MSIPTPFFQSYAVVKSSLRLTAVGDTDDAALQLQSAIREAWSVFWERLGIAATNTLIAITHIEPPTLMTDDGMRRIVAEVLEVNIIRRILYRYYRAAFTEGSSPTLQSWNQEGIFRGMGLFEVSKAIEALAVDIDRAFEIVNGTDANPSTVTANTIERPDAANGPVAIGGMVLGHTGIFGGLTPSVNFGRQVSP